MRKVWLAVALVAAIVTGAGVASAVGEGEIVNACFDRQGELRIRLDDECPRRWTPVQWNVTGPEGPQGPQGQAGPQGPEGPAGQAAEVEVARVEGPFELAAGAPYALVASVDVQAGTTAVIAELHALTAAGNEAAGLCLIGPGNGDVTEFEVAEASFGDVTIMMLDSWIGFGVTIGVYCSATGSDITISRVDLVATTYPTGV